MSISTTGLQTLTCDQFTHGDITLANVDCKKGLKMMPTKSVALILIDPPYGGQTHNQRDWDIAWSDDEWIEIIREVYRILSPGGHMIVFSSGKTTMDINSSIINGYKTLFKKKPSYYPMVWVHRSQDSGRAHQHLPRSQYESMHVYYREGEGKLMANAGTFAKSYAFDQHVGRHNVYQIDKDDCRKKPFKTVQNYFADNDANGKYLSTFDYKPEKLLRDLIRDHTKPDNVVMDLCMLHGMTAVACQMEKRKFIGFEINTLSYGLAVDRFKDQFSSIEVASTSFIATPAAPQSDYSSSTRISPTLFTTIPQISIQERITPYYETPTKKKTKRRRCGTPKCTLEDNHIGLCNCTQLQNKRRAAVEATNLNTKLARQFDANGVA